MASDAGGAPSQRPVVAWATALLLATVLPQYLVGSVAVEIREDFTFTDGQLGAAVGISFAVAAVIAPTAGRTVAWLGVRRGVLVAAALVTSSSLAMIAVADSAAAVIGLMALNGLGAGIGSPSLSTLLAERVDAARQGTAFGLFTSAPQVAAVVAGLALPLVAEPLDWRVTYLGPAAIGIASLTVLSVQGLPRAADRQGARRLDRQRLSSWVFAVATAAGLASAAVIGMRSFLVVFAVAAGFESSLAGLLLALTGLVAIASRVGFGVLSDRDVGRSLRLASELMALCAAGFVLMAIGGEVAIVLGALLAGGLGWGWQAPLSHAVVSHSPEATAVAVGLQMAGFFGGAVVGPVAVGLFAEGGHYDAAWIMCTCLAVAGAAAAILSDRLVRRDRARPQPFV